MGGLFGKKATPKSKYEIFPDQKHTKTLIWLHGIKSSAEEFLGVFGDPDRTPVDKHTKVILLNAGKKKISVAFGMRINAWFNIYDKLNQILIYPNSNDIYMTFLIL